MIGQTKWYSLVTPETSRRGSFGPGDTLTRERLTDENLQHIVTKNTTICQNDYFIHHE